MAEKEIILILVLKNGVFYVNINAPLYTISALRKQIRHIGDKLKENTTGRSK